MTITSKKIPWPHPTLVQVWVGIKICWSNQDGLGTWDEDMTPFT